MKEVRAAGHVRAWEFQVRLRDRPAFLRQYGPAGEWERLFDRAAGYLGTTLLRDSTEPGRFVTLDAWVDEAAWRAFQAQFSREYHALDEVCARLTICERPLGCFESVVADVGRGEARTGGLPVHPVTVTLLQSPA
jgi:heme-degrading monooxygenase HmoA